MKTSKEMQLKILDKMRENVENDLPLMSDVQIFAYGEWKDDESSEFLFDYYEYRIKPQTITINGVEIPKPIDIKDIDTTGNYYFPQCHEEMYGMLKGLSILEYNVFYPYATEEEAIQASKALFGVEG